MLVLRNESKQVGVYCQTAHRECGGGRKRKRRANGKAESGKRNAEKVDSLTKSQKPKQLSGERDQVCDPNPCLSAFRFLLSVFPLCLLGDFLPPVAALVWAAHNGTRSVVVPRLSDSNMPISVACRCGKAFAANDNLAGKTVKCPGCQQPLVIPAAASAGAAPPPTPASGGEKIAVVCKCGAKFAAGAPRRQASEVPQVQSTVDGWSGACGARCGTRNRRGRAGRSTAVSD